MDRAGGTSGSLGYVRGLPRAAVDALCGEFRCFIAICNPDHLFVVGGEARDIGALCNAAPSRGAARAAPMGVRIGSHTPKLQGAVQRFEHSLSRYSPSHPRLRLMSTTRQSLVSDPVRAMPDLAAQIAHPIDWEAKLVALQQRDVQRILEMGRGSALAEMAAAFSKDWDARSFDDSERMAGIGRWLGLG